ncbi:hypothetical protein [Streptomyces sp. WMMC897]|uniref:hypothetical protein n=1 Tax=Streptomyces sp. WMMC897 TaxID=3014782 RepID=UPI0022B68B32|nr:hypothetical protein [Streptomyces sp. WMMC897]MCZ7414514.1 hypothetical protein [Streptomyces sp. WMMC897]
MSPVHPAAHPPTAVLLSPRGEAVRAARTAGARTVVVGPDLAAPGMRRALADADEAAECDWSDRGRLLDLLAPFAGQSQVSVFGFDAPAALQAGYANALLRLPGNPPGPLRALTDPAALRTLANRYTSFPVRAERTDPAGLPEAAQRVGHPCLVRPATGRPRVLQSPAEAVELAGSLALDEGRLLVEEVLAGPVYDVCAHSFGGAHTIHGIAPAGFRAAVCGAPAGLRGMADGVDDETVDGLDAPAVRAVRRLVTSTLEAVDHQVGLTHVAVVLTDAGPRLLGAGPGPVPGTECALYELAITAVLHLPRRAHRAAVG